MENSKLRNQDFPESLVKKVNRGLVVKRIIVIKSILFFGLLIGLKRQCINIFFFFLSLASISFQLSASHFSPYLCPNLFSGTNRLGGNKRREGEGRGSRSGCWKTFWVCPGRNVVLLLNCK